jgi:hypothetical protein
MAKGSALLVPLLAAAIAACGGTETNDRCLVTSLAPISVHSSILAVGDTVTYSAELGPAECLPAGVTTEDWRWSSSDTLVARIDSLTGLTLGLSPGEVLIHVRHALNAGVANETGLRVVAAGSVRR